ncbi:unnamed protein product [Tilletia controversa]|uniref:Uncharacterized protein n=1 Tax=Tilletia caries TaxID=13290 RepID=A0A177V6G8_9BASI|nr:hypothetical protein CF336_g360 [Tilletia laevis]KAE8247019.1 hypothetical protein A4X03_0g7164 [Tilletia caries]CAD6959300.1 unnamed protein product [Tilletia controversa]
MAEKVSSKWKSQDYYDCRDLVQQLLAEGVSIVDIVHESKISIELAKRCADDLGVPLRGTTATTESPLATKTTPATTPTASTPTTTASKKVSAKPWRCPNFPRCFKHYSTKLGLVYHTQQGTCVGAKPAETKAEKKFVCPHGCGKEYTIKGSYDYHVSTGKCAALAEANAPPEPKLYLCKVPGCADRYQRIDGLTHHLNTAHGQFGQDLAKAMAS